MVAGPFAGDSKKQPPNIKAETVMANARTRIGMRLPYLDRLRAVRTRAANVELGETSN
jgi:hypothetical protein